HHFDEDLSKAMKLADQEELYTLDPAEDYDLDSLDVTDLVEDDEDEDELEEGEEWKATLTEADFDLEGFAESEDPFNCYMVYDEARELSLYFLKRTIEFPDALLSDTYTRFMNENL